ncbi:MAG: glycoside hydrolase family 13 protein [Anaerolineales bacterium]
MQIENQQSKIQNPVIIRSIPQESRANETRIHIFSPDNPLSINQPRFIGICRGNVQIWGCGGGGAPPPHPHIWEPPRQFPKSLNPPSLASAGTRRTEGTTSFRTVLWGSNDGNIQWDELYHNGSGYDPAQEFVPDEAYTFRGVHTSGNIYDDTSVNVTILTSQYELDGAYIKPWDGSTNLWLAMSWQKSWTGVFHGQTSHTYDVWQGTIPAHSTGTTIQYRTQLYDSGDYVYLVSSGGNSTNPLGQSVTSGQFTGSDWSYTVLDDDTSGPQFSNVAWNSGTQNVCVDVFDSASDSGDGDSGVHDDATGSSGQGMYLKWDATKATVDGGGGTEMQMSLSSGDTYCSDSTISNGGTQFYFRIYAYNNDYDNSQTSDREQSDSGTRSSIGGSGASQDGDVWWNEIYHDTRDSYYRSPFGAVSTGSTITLRVRVADSDLTGATLSVYNTPSGTQTYAMSQVSESDTTYDWYEYTIPGTDTASTRILYYKFKLIDGADEDWYIDDYSHGNYDHEDRYENGTGMMVDDGEVSQYTNNSFNITVYDTSAFTLLGPAALSSWAQQAVIYQIMPDRFRNGDSTNDSAWPYSDVYGTAIHQHTTWNEAPDDPRDCPSGTYCQKWSADFFGGDLQGIIDKLDYLQSIGVTALYLNPVFASPSNHGYDTTDYLNVSPRYGDNTLFQTLATEAQNRGIYLILDGVFNHTGSDSVYFDRYNRWDASGNASAGADSSGACENQSSSFDNFYTFNTGSGPCSGRTDGNQQYDSWWGYDSLPLLNENATLKDYIFDYSNDDASPSAVVQYWYNLGADGWRFDVADEVSHTFWQEFRTQVKTNDGLTGPLYSEVWYEATPWLYGDQLDATMNYRYRKAVLGFLIDSDWTDNDNNNDQTMYALSPGQFDYILGSIREDYPAPAWYAMMNLMGSHDTNRPLFVLREKSTSLSAALSKMKMMAALQFTYPGAPTIYYGDEVGLGAVDYGGYGTWGAGKNDGTATQDDPYNRHPYPWGDEPGTLPGGLPNTSLRDAYQTLALTRNNYDVLQTGNVTTLLADDSTNVYAYARTGSSLTPTCAIAVFNRNTSAQSVTLDLTQLDTPADCTAYTTFENVLNSGADYTVSGTDLPLGSVNGLTAMV